MRDVAGGLGMAIRELDDGRIIVNSVTEGGPAQKAGIEQGAEISEMGGMPVGDFVAEVQPYSASIWHAARRRNWSTYDTPRGHHWAQRLL